MRTVISTIKAGRSGERAAPPRDDDTLGRGMDMALTLAVFIALGALLDNWLGTLPVFTIVLVALAAVGSFIRMKYAYFAAMDRHEAARLAARRGVTPSTEDSV